MKNLIISLIKIGLSAAILIYLIYQACQGDVFHQLVTIPKRWEYIIGSFACCCAAVGITFIRWHILNRAVGLSARCRDTARIGLIGYLFNLAPVGGIVGGDILKAWILASEEEKRFLTNQKSSSGNSETLEKTKKAEGSENLNKQNSTDSENEPSQRAEKRSFLPEALATVFTDRLFGLYALFLLASMAILLSGFGNTDNQTIQKVCFGTHTVTIAWTVLILIILGPDFSHGKTIAAMGQLPVVGPGLMRTVLSIRLFQRKPVTLILATVLGLFVHFLLAVCIWMAGTGLFGEVLPLSQHLVICPLCFSTGAIPLAIGPFEAVLDFFYHALPCSSGIILATGTGLVVALAYRIMMLLVAGFGLVYYFSSRSEVQAALQNATQETGSVKENR